MPVLLPESTFSPGEIPFAGEEILTFVRIDLMEVAVYCLVRAYGDS